MFPVTEIRPSPPRCPLPWLCAECRFPLDDGDYWRGICADCYHQPHDYAEPFDEVISEEPERVPAFCGPEDENE